MVQLKFSEFAGKFAKFIINFGRYMAIRGKYHFGGCCVGCRADIAVRLGTGWCLWQVGVSGGCSQHIRADNCILLAYSVNFNSKSGRIYGYMGENTTFGSVVWAVWHISRSDLVQVVVYSKCECL